MLVTGVHLLTTYTCTLQCQHCFVWGSPWQTGTMATESIHAVLEQASELGTVDSIYFEGGEPFLHRESLLEGVQDAVKRGFRAGVVSNGYWAASYAEALEFLRPFAGLLSDLSISSDLYHWNRPLSRQAKAARRAAEHLGIPVAIMSVAQPEATNAAATPGKLSSSESRVMYRGRAARHLARQAKLHPWEDFTACTNEHLSAPGRVHVDPFGNVHVCQGISIGNLFTTRLARICREYEPTGHPIVGPLLAGGPAELARTYGLEPAGAYADACHLCDTVRRSLRSRFPDELGPDQMYGVAVDS